MLVLMSKKMSSKENSSGVDFCTQAEYPRAADEGGIWKLLRLATFGAELSRRLSLRSKRLHSPLVDLFDMFDQSPVSFRFLLPVPKS